MFIADDEIMIACADFGSGRGGIAYYEVSFTVPGQCAVEAVTDVEVSTRENNIAVCECDGCVCEG